MTPGQLAAKKPRLTFLDPLLDSSFKRNTVHLDTIRTEMVRLPAGQAAARCFVGYLLILRFTARGLLRPRLDTTGTSRISSRIA